MIRPVRPVVGLSLALALAAAICAPGAAPEAAAQELVHLPEVDRSAVLQTERALWL